MKKTIKEELEDTEIIPKDKKSLKEIFDETSTFTIPIKPSEPLLDLISSLEIKIDTPPHVEEPKTIECIKKSIDIEKIRLLKDLGIDKAIIAEELGFPLNYFKDDELNNDIIRIREELISIKEEILALTANLAKNNKELTEHLTIPLIELVTEEKLKSEEGILIPEDLEVDVTIIRSKTGKKYIIKENAVVAIKQTQETLDKLDSLMENL